MKLVESNMYKWIRADENGNIYSNRRKYVWGFKKLSLIKDKDWYLYFHTKEKSKWMNIKVHKIITECFLWERKSWIEVNHKDWNRSNNNISNLEYCTRSENIKHTFKVLWRKMPSDRINSIIKWREKRKHFK